MYLYQLQNKGTTKISIVIYFWFDWKFCLYNTSPLNWTHFICNNNNIHANILTDYTCSTATYKNIQPLKKQLHTNSPNTLFELHVYTLLLILSLNDLLNMNYQISVCFIPLVILFHFSSAPLLSLLTSYLGQWKFGISNIWPMATAITCTCTCIFFSTIECVCYYIDCKVLTILKTNLYHTSIWINDKYLSMSYKQRALISSIASKIRGTLRYNPCILKVFQAFI